MYHPRAVPACFDVLPDAVLNQQTAGRRRTFKLAIGAVADQNVVDDGHVVGAARVGLVERELKL